MPSGVIRKVLFLVLRPSGADGGEALIITNVCSIVNSTLKHEDEYEQDYRRYKNKQERTGSF